MLPRRHYTPDEANQLLPYVDRVLRAVRVARERVAARGDDGDLALRAETTGGAWPGREHAEASLVISLGFERLGDLDIVVRDVDRGILDFPSMMDGREVHLCWHLGEPAVAHWHELDSGFAGRRPLGRAARPSH